MADAKSKQLRSPPFVHALGFPFGTCKSVIAAQATQLSCVPDRLNNGRPFERAQEAYSGLFVRVILREEVEWKGIRTYSWSLELR